MKHLKLYEEFEKKDIIKYKGKAAQVLNKDGDKVTIKLFKPNKVITVDKSYIEKPIKCLAQCDKRIVGEKNNRYIKCFSCGKEFRKN